MARINLGGAFVHWGYRDSSLFIPESSRTLDIFNREVFYLMRSLGLSATEILSWPSSFRKEILKLHKEEEEAIKRLRRNS
jgi:hypothetical protein